jgi:ADP-ribose pyrophosphatase YjhB (NUDIX family)
MQVFSSEIRPNVVRQMFISDPRSTRFRFCACCGAALEPRDVNGRLRPVCGTCGFVLYLDPKVACGVLIAREGRVLLVRRRFEPGRGLWCLPCGFEDADESPEQAAIREAREETGLDITLAGLIGAYYYTDDPRGSGILLAFRAHCPPDAIPRAGDDADDVEFFAPDSLPPLSHHTHRAAIADWLREQGTGNREQGTG